jgi:hypothetical protein
MHKFIRNKDEMKKCQLSPIFTEMQIKTTMSYVLTLVEIAIIKKTKTTCIGKNVEKKGHCALWQQYK